MADALGQAQIVVFTKTVTDSPESAADFKDNCTCSQGPIETSALFNDASLQNILTSLDPQEIKTISDFVHLSDLVKRNQEA